MSVHIKKLVMHGFKSFARKTEIPLEDSMNVIVGPNGSGKSNITDALCFVLGRISIKSIRAAKAANLLFSGNQTYKGSQEASVELIFDNSDKTFGIDKPEISIKRVVRKNGQSIYKINNETKTRQELLELLAQGGIDPHGFNIVLQGEIQSLVNSTAEERRKILEDVAGISVYETRKHKSIHELEKTDEKLKEVTAVLRERMSYLKNLERERQDAINFQKLEDSIRRCKKTLLSRNINEKSKEVWGIDKLIENNVLQVSDLKKKINERNIGIEELQIKIVAINRQIQESTSNDQENLHRDVSDLKADIAGLFVRRENFENRMKQGKNKIIDLSSKIENLEEEIKDIQTQSPEIRGAQEKQKVLQQKFDKLEEMRRKFYVVKSDLATNVSQKENKERSLVETKKEISLISQNIDSFFREIKYAKSLEQAESIKVKVKQEIYDLKEKIINLESGVLESERRNAVLEEEIRREEKLRDEIIGLDKCPVCRQDVTEEYKSNISSDSQGKIDLAKEEETENINQREEKKNTIIDLRDKLDALNSKLSEIEIDIVKLNSAQEKKERLNRLGEEVKIISSAITSLNEKIHKLREEFEKLKDVENDYDEVRLSLQELSFSDIDVDAQVNVKQREMGRLNLDRKSIMRDIEESEVELKKVNVLYEDKAKLLGKKEEEERKLYESLQGFFEQKNVLQDSEKVLETEIIGYEHTLKSIEERINQNKISIAQYKAQIESLELENKNYEGVQEFNIPVAEVKDKLQKAQFRLSHIGNVNLKALEVYDRVEEQVGLIKGKVETINQEKAKIEKIISEIDGKKKKAFMITLNAVNEYFTRNFSQLSRKGEVSLELEDKKDPFAGGLSILVKVSRGRYFDIASLSGGEKTMVALSLIFAIQEYRPYCFYIFDEIDAALDKHNSELLAALIKKYMKSGQYIVITHNDTLISEATTLYGVSMQENISKVISLKV